MYHDWKDVTWIEMSVTRVREIRTKSSDPRFSISFRSQFLSYAQYIDRRTRDRENSETCWDGGRSKSFYYESSNSVATTRNNCRFLGYRYLFFYFVDHRDESSRAKGTSKNNNCNSTIKLYFALKAHLINVASECTKFPFVIYSLADIMKRTRKRNRAMSPATKLPLTRVDLIIVTSEQFTEF